MKNTISENIKMATTFTYAITLAIIFTFSTLSFVTRNYSECTKKASPEKSVAATNKMEESTAVLIFKFFL